MVLILLVDDHAPFRACVRALLDREAGFDVVAEADDGEAALALVAALPLSQRPHVAVLDVRLPGISGIEVARRLQALPPVPAVLALSSHDDPALVHAMQQAGARGYLLKDEAQALLVHAVRAVAAGGQFFSAALGIPHAPSPHPADTPPEGGRLS